MRTKRELKLECDRIGTRYQTLNIEYSSSLQVELRCSEVNIFFLSIHNITVITCVIINEYI